MLYKKDFFNIYFYIQWLTYVSFLHNSPPRTSGLPAAQLSSCIEPPAASVPSSRRSGAL